MLKHEGVVTIVSWSLDEEPHLTNTWNSYLRLVDDHFLLIPAGGMKTMEKDVSNNPKVKISIGSKEVIGFNNYQGTGFLIEGKANFVYGGPYFDLLKQTYDWISRVLVIEIILIKQLI